MQFQRSQKSDGDGGKVRSHISFQINGKRHEVGNSHPPTMSLNEYLREVAGLTGTKFMCRTGNCGCCTVSVKYYDVTTKTIAVKAVVSCLFPLYSCDGREITTTEGIGGKHDGFHPTQTKIADYNGSQCGWCTPGMVMSMYSYLKENPNPTKESIENVIDGNICRCTGYRSILNAFQTFSTLGTGNDVCDLEDLCNTDKGKKACEGKCFQQLPLQMDLNGARWFKPTNLQGLMTIVERNKAKQTRLVGGNTTFGFDLETPQHDVYIDISGVSELFQYSVTDTVYFGACVTLSHMIDLLTELSEGQEYKYCAVLAKHIKKVASTSIRNVGTWSGNLMARHADHSFVSDIFTIFVTVGARLLIASGGSDTSYTLEEFLTLDMRGKVIISMMLSPMTVTEVVRTYKIMPRGEFALAYVNAGYHFNIDDVGMVKDRPTIVYGGINTTTVHAYKTEEFLFGTILDTNALQGALSILKNDLEPDIKSTYGSSRYRTQLAVGLLYKFFLAIRGDKVNASLRTGGIDIERPMSTGTESYESDRSKWPVTQPMAKTSARIQASGEALYIPDMKSGSVHAAFVLTTVANGKIQKVDPSPALEIPGVIRYISAHDIPPGGQNNFLSSHGVIPYPEEEKIFCEEQVLFSGQAVGMIVADTQTKANFASKKVAIEYTDVQRPVTDLREAISMEMFHPYQPPEIKVGDPDASFNRAHKVFTGEVAIGTQYHLTMETQSCLCVPDEEGFLVYPSSQWPDMSQRMAAQVLGAKDTDIRVEVRRLGGGYGVKATRNLQVSSACVLASYLTQRPVKIQMDLQSNMKMVGKRFPYLAKYKVAVDASGKLLAIDVAYFCDCGSCGNDSTVTKIHQWTDNAYFCANWRIKAVSVKTHTPANTFCRAPGSTPAIFITESILEHVAFELGKSSLEVKFNNLYQAGQVNPILEEPLPDCNIRDIFNQLKTSAHVEERAAEIDEFNKVALKAFTHRWRKRGLSVVPMKFGTPYGSHKKYNVLLSVYNGDGSVTISHGGVEMGQGLDTKVIQTCAFELGIEMDLIRVRPSDTHSNANSQVSGGSVSSELCCLGAIECCKVINTRLEPYREKNQSWPDLIETAFREGVDLTARFWLNPGPSGNRPQYQTYGVTCTEVELDVLTGQNQVTRVDMLYDCGESLNPDIDMGQAQGAFVMGLGLFLLEDIKYDPKTGQSYNANLWSYHVPTVKDIPIDFRISFLKNPTISIGALPSKVIGEPPLCMSCSALFALKNAIAAARKDAGNSDYFRLDAPCTVEMAQMMCLNDTEQYTM